MSQAPKIDFGHTPFEFKKETNYFLIRLAGQLDMDLGKEFERRLNEKLVDVVDDIVVDLDRCKSMHPSWLRLLTLAVNHAKEKQKRLRCVDASGKHGSYFLEQGMGSTLIAVPDLAAAMKDFSAPPAGAPKPTVTTRKIDVNFINPFLEGTLQVLKIQAGTEAKAGTPFLKEAKETLAGDISGVIGLVSEHFTGSVVITFPEETFLKIMSRMLGEEFTSLTPEIQDGAAELTNIIFGHAKKVLNEKGYGIKMAIPSVVSGKGHSIQNASTNPRMAIPFDCDLGKFAIEICLTGPSTTG